MVDKIFKIVNYFKHSSYASAQLKATSEHMDIVPLKLKNYIVTRWNSTNDVMKRDLKMKNAILLILAILGTHFIKIMILNYYQSLLVTDVYRTCDSVFNVRHEVFRTETKILSWLCLKWIFLLYLPKGFFFLL